MIKQLRTVLSLAAFLLLIASSVTADEWGQIEKSQALAAAAISADCVAYPAISGQVSGPGDTNGSFGTFTEGDTFTFTATGNGTGTWRIVGDPGGALTLASGGTFPGTLTYAVPQGQVVNGVGFFVDTYSGQGDTISGSCGEGAPAGPTLPVPTLSFWSLILVMTLLGLFGFAAFQRKRTR